MMNLFCGAKQSGAKLWPNLISIKHYCYYSSDLNSSKGKNISSLSYDYHAPHLLAGAICMNLSTLMNWAWKVVCTASCCPFSVSVHGLAMHVCICVCACAYKCVPNEERLLGQCYFSVLFQTVCGIINLICSGRSLRATGNGNPP